MRTKITPNVYKNIHVMCKSGMTRKDIAEVFNLNRITVGKVLMSESLDDYRSQNTWKQNRKSVGKNQSVPVKVPEHTEEKAPPITDMKLPGGTLSANYQFSRMVELLKNQNELLTLISKKLAYIIDELT